MIKKMFDAIERRKVASQVILTWTLAILTLVVTYRVAIF